MLAGGTQVALLSKSGLLDAETLVWIGRVPELRRIDVDGEALSVGATVTLAELSRSGHVRRLHRALAEAAAKIGNARVRAVATVGGHLVHADPRQDLAPVLLVLGARVQVAGPNGRRDMALGPFFTGFMTTALEPDELVTAIEVPPPPAGRRAVYARFAPNSASDYPIAGVAAAVTLRDGEVVDASVALGAGSARPRLVPAAAAHLVGTPDAAKISLAAGAVQDAAEPSSDQRGSADYKKAMVGLWTRRLLTNLLSDQIAYASTS